MLFRSPKVRKDFNGNYLSNHEMLEIIKSLSTISLAPSVNTQHVIEITDQQTTLVVDTMTSACGWGSEVSARVTPLTSDTWGNSDALPLPKRRPWHASRQGRPFPQCLIQLPHHLSLLPIRQIVLSPLWPFSPNYKHPLSQSSSVVNANVNVSRWFGHLVQPWHVSSNCNTSDSLNRTNRVSRHQQTRLSH